MNLFFPMLLVGLVTSVHCVTMCGTLVLSYAIKGDGGGTWRERMLPHAAYQGAKILSYMAVGLLLGAIGAAFDLGGIRGWVTVFAGVFMVLMGLNMTGKFPWLRWITLRPPKFLMTALMKLRKKANADASAGESTLLTPIMFGAVTGLMPCGPLQSAQIAAAGAGSPLSGAIAMLGFGLGTMPLMLGFGAVSGMLGNKFKERMMVVAAVVIMLVGLVMANRGAMLVGSPVTFQAVKAAVVGTPGVPEGGQQFTTGEDGVTEVKLTIANVRFQPQNVAIPADTPVRLIVDRQEDNACSDQLAIPQLGILVNLAPNAVTTVDIPASKAGNYTLTCGMGMMAGQLSVGGGAAGGSRLPLLALLAAVAGAGAWALVRRTPQPKPAPAGRGAAKQPVATGTTVFGFSAQEGLVIGVAVVAAVMAGLYLGGYF